MVTVELHHTRKESFGNGLIARGFVRTTVRQVNMPENVVRGWSFGLGRGLSGVVRPGGWTRLESDGIGGES
ncbi:MAG: hypothetical protein HQL91_04175 [Magnetococcales bacterium]|nr:hypothetical protein [Magnetococcales bacterium]